MIQELRVGIAGYGVVGARRHEIIKEHPNLKLVAVCDRKFEIEDVKDGIFQHKNYHDLLKHDLDVLFVCMTNDVAPEVTAAGLNKGLHVFCEKPPGRNVEDIKRVIEVEKANPHLKLKYGFNHRYHDSVREAQKIISSGQFGRIINMRGIYGKSAFIQWPRNVRGWRTERAIAGGGILLDQGIHMVDLMRHFGGEFTQVKSFISNDFWNLDVEDNAYSIMKTDSGVVAILHSTATQWRHRFSLEISLEQGALVLAGILSGTKSYGQETLTVIYRSDEANGNPREQMSTYINDNSWRDEIFEFVDCIISNKRVEIGNSNDALRSMELVYKIYSSDESWREKFKLPKM